MRQLDCYSCKHTRKMTGVPYNGFNIDDPQSKRNKLLIDDKDKKILEVLTENSNLSSHKISKKTLIPVSTVNHRVKKLKKLGVIKKYTIEIDKSKLGFNFSAYIFIHIAFEELKKESIEVKDLTKLIKKKYFVESIEQVTGNVDMVVKVNLKNVDELNDYVINNLGKIKGIGRTNTAFILRKD